MTTQTYRPTDVFWVALVKKRRGSLQYFSQLDSNFHPQEHSKRHVGFVSAPVFARPDGMRRGEATFPVP